MTELPLFPLNNILLPGALLPLHVFESRFIRLIQDTIARSPIGIIQPRPTEDEEEDNSTQQPLSPMGCSGKIVRFEEMENGRYFIVLRGERRFHYVQDSLTSRGYREAEIRWVIEQDRVDPEESVILDRGKFLDNLGQYLDKIAVKADFSEIENSADIQLINTLAMLLPLQYTEKQALLEANSVMERLHILENMMHKDSPPPVSKQKWQH